MEQDEKIYHENELGCTRKCTCYHAVHVNFGNVSLLLSKQQLRDFNQYVQEAIDQCRKTSTDRNAREIFIPTRDLCIMFAMSYNELLLLQELADETLMMIEVEEALE